MRTMFATALVSTLACACAEPSMDAGPKPECHTLEWYRPSGEAGPRVGFEILEFKWFDEIVVWVSPGMTQREFDAIDLGLGWFKNQPREVEPDGGAFARSPGAAADGDFTCVKHHGHWWVHNAEVVEVNVPLEDDGLLKRHLVAKHHSVVFDAGRTLWVLTSPAGERYVRISRDANRTQEAPTLPEGWRLTTHVRQEKLEFTLPNPTVNIRADNEDSFQGPVAFLEAR
jgi:hypothetical protein